jgi:hypothetical protein
MCNRDGQELACMWVRIESVFAVFVVIMSGLAVAPTAASTTTPQRKRKISDRTEANAVDALFEGGHQKDVAFILKKLEAQTTLIPFLASWLRDGTLEASYKRQQNKVIVFWVPHRVCIYIYTSIRICVCVGLSVYVLNHILRNCRFVIEIGFKS